MAVIRYTWSGLITNSVVALYNTKKALILMQKIAQAVNTFVRITTVYKTSNSLAGNRINSFLKTAHQFGMNFKIQSI